MDLEAQMRRWLAERERDGLMFYELSKRSGVPATTLSGWARKVRAEPSCDSRVRFVELRAATPIDRPNRVEIVTRTACRLLFDLSVDPDQVTRLVAALDRC